MFLSHVLILGFIQKLNEDYIIIIVVVMSVFEVFQQNLTLTKNDMLPSLSKQEQDGDKSGDIIQIEICHFGQVMLGLQA